MNGLYIHFPYCIHKCSYCDFYSIENLNSRNQFTVMLSKEISLRTKELEEKPLINTIFIGGGTPSLMKPHHFNKIAQSIFDNFILADDYEWTIECNPGTIDIKHLEEYRNNGVNRISFGVQSFVKQELEFLERIHSVEDIYKSVETARKIGFDNISVDLMFALPVQSLESWKYSLQKAIELDTEHISAYSLIYEEGTPLYQKFLNGNLNKTEDDLDYEFYQTAVNYLNDAGFEQYEVSNYAKNNKYCFHNQNYWSQGNYYAFGPSAHGYLDHYRYWNFRSNEKYFQSLGNNQLPEENHELLDRNQIILERIYLELRAAGLDFKKFQIDFGIDLNKMLSAEIELFQKNQLAIFDKNKLKLTSGGYFVSDSITLKISEKIEKFL